MKKIVKMSLVAAVAVAGLTTANAKPLEEAIKDVDVSGTVVYRYNDYNNDVAGDKTHSSDNYYKIGLNLSSKVNDDVKLNTRFLVAADNGDKVGLDTGTGADANVNTTLSNVYFSYTGLQNTTVNVGKQGLTTPWTVAVDSDGNEQTGTGILALSTWGPVTVAAAYFNQTNLNYSDVTYNTTKVDGVLKGSADIATLGVIANVGPVTLDAWYLDMADLTSTDYGFDTYTIGAKGGFDVSGVKLGADVRYTSLDLDNYTDDNNVIKLVLTAKAGIFNAKYMYAGTDKQGGLTALDNDATTTALTWNITSNGKKDADLHNLSLGVQALDTLHVSANWTKVEYNKNGANGAVTDDSQEELYAQVTYKMSKNLSTYVRFGEYTQETDNVKDVGDTTRGRLQVQYSF
jgi:hypothetical protein